MKYFSTHCSQAYSFSNHMSWAASETEISPSHLFRFSDINVCVLVWLLTSDLKLAVFSRSKHGVGQAEPGQLFAELRQEVVCEEPHYPSQDVQDETESRLKKCVKNIKNQWNVFPKTNEILDLLQWKRLPTFTRLEKMFSPCLGLVFQKQHTIKLLTYSITFWAAYWPAEQ